MTMLRKRVTIPAGQFKAKCLALLDEVAATGRPIIVTKRGKAVAMLVPVDDAPPPLLGSIVREGDIVSPLDESWGFDK
jgi:prevent-host-death family protein